MNSDSMRALPDEARRTGSAPATPAARWYWLGLAGIVIVAATLRGLVVHEHLRDNPLSGCPLVDGDTYWNWAGRIAAGQLRGSEPFFSGPLYPYVLGVIRALGGGLAAVYVFQVALDLTTLTLLAVIARRRFGPGVGLLSAGLFALMLEPVFYTTRILSATIQLPLVCLSWLAMLAGQQRRSAKWALVTGATAGLLTLSCPPALLCLPLAALWWWWQSGRGSRAVGQALALLAGGAAVIAPATIHNYLAAGEFIPVSGQAGVTFAHGNAPESTGVYTLIPGVSFNREAQNRDARRLCRLQTGNPNPSWRQTERYFFRRGLEYWRSQPAAAATLVARKAYWFLSGRNWSEIYKATGERAEGFLSRLWLTPVHTAWLIPVALVALFVWLRRPLHFFPELLLFGVPLLVVLVFYYSPRYRFPAVPVIVVAAAFSLSQLAKWRQQRGMTGAILAAAIIGLSLGSVNRALGFDPLTPARTRVWEQIAEVHAKAGRWAEALQANEHALQLDSRSSAAALEASRAALKLGRLGRAWELAKQAVESAPQLAYARDQLGQVLLLQDRLDEAISHFRAAVELAPLEPELHNNLAAALIRRGDLATAEQHLRRALTLEPDQLDAHLNLGLLLHQRGALAEALSHFRAALALDPRSVQAHFHAGAILHAQGDAAGAIRALRQAHELAPEHPQIANHLAWCLATTPGLTPPERAAALPLAEQAVAATGRQSAAVLDTLAAALAANGHFADALRVVEEALARAQAQGPPELLAELRQRLELYRSGQPYLAPSASGASETQRADSGNAP